MTGLCRRSKCYPQDDGLVGQRWMFVQLDACPWRTSNHVSNVVWFVIAGAHSPIDLNGDAVRRSRLTARACSRTVECGDRRGARRASSRMDGRTGRAAAAFPNDPALQQLQKCSKSDCMIIGASCTDGAERVLSRVHCVVEQSPRCWYVRTTVSWYVSIGSRAVHSSN